MIFLNRFKNQIPHTLTPINAYVMNEFVWIAGAIIIIFILYEPISTILAFLEKYFVEILFGSILVAFFIFSIKDFHKKNQVIKKETIEQKYTLPRP